MREAPVLEARESYRVEVLRDVGVERERCERDLLDAGAHLHLYHRCAWATSGHAAASWLVAVRDGAGRCRSAIPVAVHRSRALPGHVVLRAERLGPTLLGESGELALDALAAMARSDHRVLRVHAEVFSRDAEVRGTLGAQLERLGFRRAGIARAYDETLVLDLTPDAETVFASFSRLTQRQIRNYTKYRLALRPIVDAAFAERIDALERLAMERTGGRHQARDWTQTIAFSRQHPDLSRLVGIFRCDAEGPESLVGFVWSGWHGDHASYDAGASTRPPGPNVGVSYPLLWDVILWAKQSGATWFDLGGVTRGSRGSDDRLGGISDFKRGYGGELTRVGEDWVMEPRPRRAMVARAVSGGVAWLSNLRRRPIRTGIGEEG